MKKSIVRKGLVLGIIVLFVGMSIVPGISIEIKKMSAGKDRGIIYVDDDNTAGPWDGTFEHPYQHIQDGVDASSNGDTIFVFSGLYYENVLINKDYINLTGEDKYTTVIDGGGGIGQGISILENHHHNYVSGFTVINTSYTGIMVTSYTAHSGAHCDYNTISDCIVRDYTHIGIRIYGARWTCHADFNTVINCEVYNGDTGLQVNGLYAYNNSVINCKIYNTSDGMNGGGNNMQNTLVSNCEMFNNSNYGLYLQGGAIDNLLFHNNFLNNGQNVIDEGVNNIWYNATLQEGNYYDDYTGIDANGDGIGDTPYIIGGSAGEQDLHPLMYPWYPTHPDTVYVDDDYDISTPGFGYDRFNRIQYGINEVEGSTVYVYSGNYYENVVVSKTINLIGENKDTTIIDGGGSGDVVYVSADWVNISGFTIQNSGSIYTGDAGIDVRSNFNNISDNIITLNNDEGLLFSASSYNYVIDNIICSNHADGIELSYSNNNIIYGNNISSNSDGIEVAHSNNNIFKNNSITLNNDEGIDLIDSNSNTISGNTIESNIENGIELWDSANNNLVYHNNLINNSINAYDAGTNFWYNATIQEGNYYDDYTGIDANGDGIGDTPYDIPGGSNQDLYPLMYPFNSGLVACWHFDEGSGSTAYDSSGNGNDGTIYGASWTTGVNGTALDFDGDGDYVEFPPIPQITDIPIDEITIEGWIYLQSSSGYQQFIEAQTSTDEIHIETIESTTQLDFNIYDDDGVVHHVRTSPLSLYEWHHIVGTYDGSKQCIYVDGNLEDVDLGTGTFTITTGFTIGKDYEQWGQFLNGILDEISIYNRPLTPEEIQQHYEEYVPPDTVYVDDDYNPSTPGWGYDHFDIIQDGVDAIDEGGTVYVFNGTYYENVVIDKNIYRIRFSVFLLSIYNIRNCPGQKLFYHLHDM